MKSVLKLPSKELLAERLNYDPETGKLFWKHADGKHFKTERGRKVFNSQCAGREAGHKHFQENGTPHAIVIRITILKKDMWLLAHRVAYQLMGVEIPEGMEIDHKDRNPWNNAWTNLRLATSFQNSCNQIKSRKDPLAEGLPKGVSRQAGRFKAQIKLNGKKRHIGMYGTPEEAAEAYRKAAEPSHGAFFRQN